MPNFNGLDKDSDTATLPSGANLSGLDKDDDSVQQSYHEASQYNPDHVSKALDISKSTGIDPQFALGNIDSVKKQADMPDFDLMKSTHPVTHKFFSSPENMGKAWDDHKPLMDIEGHAQTARMANGLLDAAISGFQSSATGLRVRGGMPNVRLGDDATFWPKAVEMGAGMLSDLPLIVAGGSAGGIVGGPLGAGAGGFALPAAVRQYLVEKYTHGSVDSAEELIRRAKAIAIPAAKQGAVGLAMAATGGAAELLGAGSILTKSAEGTAMTLASSAVEGKKPTLESAGLNAVALIGAHVAGITWDRLGEAAKASKLRTRDPQAFATLADDSAPRKYIPVEKWDSVHAENVEEINKKLGIEDAYKAAKATGGSVELTPGQYTSADMDAHREAFKEDVKDSPEAKTVNQIKDEIKEQKEAAEEPEKPDSKGKLPPPDPAAVNVRIVHHAETAIDGSGEPTPEETAQGILPEPQTHGPKFKGLALTEEGQAQAEKVAETLKDQGISRMYSGDSERTKQTARAISEPTSDPRFAPIDLKGNLDGMTIKEYKPILEEALKAWAKDPDSKQLGNESFNEFQSRNLEAIREATEKSSRGENIGITLSSDSMQLFKLIAENGGVPIKGETILRMAEKENIKPIDVHSYKIDPKTARLVDSALDLNDSKGTGPIPFVPMPDLTDVQRSEEKRFAAKLSKENSLEEYAKLKGTDGGKTFDVDLTRNLSDEYSSGKDGATLHTLGTHRPGSSWVRRQLRARFQEPARGPFVSFSGGAGSGKSTIKSLPEVKSYIELADTVLDGTMAKESVAVDQIESALKSGRDVKIIHVHRPFESAVKSVANRFYDNGRYVPSETIANDHVMSQEVLFNLAARYANDPRVKINIYANPDSRPGSGIRPYPLTLDELQELRYNKSGDLKATIAEKYDVARKLNEGPEKAAEEIANKSRRDAPGQQGNGPETGRSDFYSRQGRDDLPSPGAVEPPNPREERAQATAQAIDSARQETGQTSSPIPGLDPKAQNALSKMRDEARAEAEKILMRPQLEELKARNRKLIDDERDRAKGLIENQVNQEPIFKAFSMFPDMDKDAVWKHANKYINNQLDDSAKAGFDTVAEMSGFSSADEMAHKLLMTDPGPALKSEVSERLKAHMAQFADLKDSGALRAEALKAVHNEKSLDLLALQAKLFDDMANQAEFEAGQAPERPGRSEWISFAKQRAKELARDAISNKPVETAGRYQSYYTEERNAAVRVEKAKAKEDWPAASQAAQEQLNAHALAIESARVRDKIAEYKNSIENHQSAKMNTWKDQDNFFQAANILKRFGFERPDFDPLRRQESLSDWADKMAQRTGDPDDVNIPDWIKNEGVEKNWKNITPDELEDVRNTLNNIKHVGNQVDELRSVARGEQRENFVSDLVDEAHKNVSGGHTPGADPRASFREKMWNISEKWGNISYAVETMLSKLDGWKLGGKWGRIIESKSRSQDAEATRKQADTDWWKEQNTPYTAKELIDRDSKKIFIPEINDSLSKNAMIVAVANTGTESNARVLKEGRGWTDSQIEAIKSHMDARDFDLMQAMLDRHENVNRPELAEMAKRRTGFEPKWIDATPIKTPFGDKRGGYLPLIRDNRVSSRGMEESSLIDPPQTYKAASYQGFNKERNRHAEYKVSLDINDQLRAFNRVSHYLTMQDWVSDMNSLMNHEDIKSVIIDSSGKDRLNTINNWVKDVAGNGQRVPGSLDAPIRALTDRTTISQLGSKLSVTIATGTHGIFAVGGVDPENFGPIKVYGGLLNFMGEMVKDPLHHFSESKDFMLENSAYMKQHARESESSIQEAADRMAGNNKFGQSVRNFAFSAMHGLYNLTITPIWNDAYKTGLILKDANHDAAVEYANMIVRNSSPPGRTSDIPTIMHDSAVGKLLFLMHGFADRQYQMMVRAGGRYGVQARQAGSAMDVAKATSQFLGTYANVLVIPGMAIAGLKMIGSRDDEREHKILQKHMIRSLSPLTPYPVISAMQDMVLDASLGVRGNTSLSPVGAMFDSYQHFVHETTSRRSANEQIAEGAANIATFAVPYPASVNDALFNLTDIIFNGMQARPSDLIRRRPRRERGE